MSFGRETDEQAGPPDNNPPPVPPKGSKYNWLGGGIFSICLSIINLIYYLYTGEGLPGPSGRRYRGGAGGVVLLSLLAFIFGVIAIIIHFRKSTQSAFPPVNKSTTDFCPNCGTTLVPGASKCPICGQLSQAQIGALPLTPAPGLPALIAGRYGSIIVATAGGLVLVVLLAVVFGSYAYYRYRPGPGTPAAQQKGKAGFVDKTGRFVIAPKYDDALPFGDHLAPIEIDEKWGYIDNSGAVVITPKFDEAWPFSGGLAEAKRGDKWGYINTTGAFAIEPSFDMASNFDNGIAAVETNGKWSFIDRQGKLAINQQFDSARPFSNGLAAVKEGDKWGFINRRGKYVIDPEFENAGVFGEGWAPVQKAGKWFYIDSGRIEMKWEVEPEIAKHDPKYDEASRFTEGLAAVKIGEWGYIDDKRWPKIPFRFTMAYPFHEGFAAVEQGSKWGYIDKTGTFVIRPQYELADRFSEGLAPVVTVNPP